MARAFQIFNTVPGSGVENSGEERGRSAPFLEPEVRSKNNSRSGVTRSNSTINNWAYGFGGTRHGIQPPPGITGFSVNHLNRGSIRKANIQIQAYNKFQLDVIEVLYLRLGFSVLVEFGHSHYIDGREVKKVNGTLLDEAEFWNPGTDSGNHLNILQSIKNKQSKYKGSYDAIFGVVSNFNWTINSEGIYTFDIEITSLGSVIESLKINHLPARNLIYKVGSDEVEINDRLVNRDAITNYLYCSQQETEEKKREIFQAEDGNFRYVNPETNIFSNTNFNDHSPRTWHNYHYIRLGRLLEYVKQYLVPHVNTKGGGECPIVNIEYDNVLPCSFVNSIETPIISINPGICVIKPYLETLRDLDLVDQPHYDFLDTLNNFTIGDGKGDIRNIYLEFNYIIGLMESLSNPEDEGKITLYDFINTICNDINASLGHSVQLEPTIDEERNYLVIRDQKVPITRENPSLVRANPNDSVPSKSLPFEIYGIPNNGEASFVRNFEFTTEITNKLASQISIGATANSQTLTEDATSIQNWNTGLRDRFKLSNQDGEKQITTSPFSCGKDQSSPVNQRNGYINSRGEFIEVDPNAEFSLVAAIRNLFRYNGNFRTLERENYILNLALTLGIAPGVSQSNFVMRRVSQLDGGIPFGTQLGYGAYLRPEFEPIQSRLYTLLTNQYQRTQSSTGDESQRNKSNIGFIPVNLSLQIDGLSGIRIYNQLSISQQNILPPNYPEVLDFIVMRIGHQVEGNDWVTNIEAIAKTPEAPPSNNRENNNNALPEVPSTN